MRYIDRPEVEVSTVIDAPVMLVWDLVSDIATPTRFSPEVQRVEWLDDGAEPAVGRHFRGYNVGRSGVEWDADCVVTQCEPGHVFEWTVDDVDDPVAIWRFTLTATDHGTELTQWAKMGPGRSGVTMAIEKTPERESEIVAGRLDEWRTSMAANLQGIKEIAEDACD